MVEYPWHPLRGKRLRLVRRTGHRGRDSVHVETRSGASSELPAWMCSASACASMTLGPPLVRVGALNELRAVLTAMLANRSLSRSSSFSPKEEALDATTNKPGRGATHARLQARG